MKKRTKSNFNKSEAYENMREKLVPGVHNDIEVNYRIMHNGEWKKETHIISGMNYTLSIARSKVLEMHPHCVILRCSYLHEQKSGL